MAIATSSLPARAAAACPPGARSSEPPVTWFGPATVTFDIDFPGNPYDPDENDVRVRFLSDSGRVFERIAYFNEAGTWRATLVAEEAGRYRAALVRNGALLPVEAREGDVLLERRLPRGFLRVDPAHRDRFRWDDGEPYYPLGFNLGWQMEGLPPMTTQIATMGERGMNWTRVWASGWDGKNPFWPQGGASRAPDRLWEPALGRWQSIIDACERANIALQVVLLHHGAFSTAVNPDWAWHPWNVERGGFLRDPADFFSDGEARRRVKIWLRYAVARFSHSPSIMAWELWNEVEWTDAALLGRWAEIAAWHADMARYLRSIDPYRHLVTTSATLAHPALWKEMDYLQPHAYAIDVAAALRSAALPPGKPAFFGEFGERAAPAASAREVLRDGLYAGILKDHAGSPMFWYWDLVEKYDLYGELGIAAKVIALSGLAARPAARPRLLRFADGGAAPALGEAGWLLARLKAPGVAGARLSGAGLADGDYDETAIDLDTGNVARAPARVERAALTVAMPFRDSIVLVERRP